ncbi:glycine oxidase ThiO [Lacicoccus alkaliphilus]|uniref:glycine oxidase n=1 Tax=Lacicoccus alkaliphilus DSM 16010 TaxID=1123231 RepID=A0A1M7IV50_9BACL|nr:glycine oxidase ThiO [Salinicoccus alkaliphilus]SHM44227.1 glycine oxidase [Salinicoccus alkaliphilus DSM 16010]
MGVIKFDVITVGAGVMGLSIAAELAENGLKVAVIDRDEAERHASFKAGGMLGAQNEFYGDSPSFRLARASRAYFKPLSESLLETTGIDIEYRETGLIKIADSSEDAENIRRQHAFLNGHNEKVQLLDENAVLDLSNQFLRPNEHPAMLIPADGQVNANKYTRALTERALINGVTRIGHTEVLSIERLGESYTVKTSKGIMHAGKVVVTAGAWAQELIEPFGVQSSITGVKGEVMLLEHPGVRMDHTLFMTNGCYIIPKRNHRFLLGATSLFNDYSAGMTDAGEAWLWKEALRRLPRLKGANVLMKTSGIRPYTPDAAPVMDEVHDGLFLVGGHYRNGILLSPITGRLMSKWIIRGGRPEGLQEFTIERMKTDAMHHQ